MEIRQLRLAIEAKLKERKALITQNNFLNRQNQMLLDIIKSPTTEMIAQECADEIVSELMAQAVKASEAVAEQTMETGDYIIGINIPALYIRKTILRGDVHDKDFYVCEERAARTINYRGGPMT